MQLIFTPPGILGLVLHVLIFLYFAKALPLGALSLPCVAVLTSFVYFYFMPVTALAVGNDYLFGMQLNSLEETHWLALLYLLGVALASGLHLKRLRVANPSKDESLVLLNPFNFTALWALPLLSIAALVSLGQLNLAVDADYRFATEATPLNFLNLGLNMVQPLTLIYLVRNGFRLRSLGLLAAVLHILTVAGFRSRILILLCAAVSAFMLARRIKIRVRYVLAGAIVAISLMNAIGILRQYGAGLQFERLQSQSLSLAETITGFGGELGMVFVTQNAASNPPEWIWFDPYIIAVFRYIPSFIWPDKPVPTYLALFSSGFSDQSSASRAGMAAPQQVEMLYQFGWLGVFMLSFIYYTVISYLHGAMARVSHEARIAGLSLIPAFFGFYMQSRGYFFQMSAEAVFTFLPLFLLNKRIRLSKHTQSQPAVNRGLSKS